MKRIEDSKVYYDIDKIRSIGEEVFQNLYTYPDQDPIRPHEKVRIICSKHGEYKQILNSHKNGHHCNKCSYELRGKERSKSLEDFIQDAINIHGDKHDYSKYVYINKYTKGIISCKTCSLTFSMTPQLHLTSKLGCPQCRVKSVNGDNIYSKAIKAGLTYEEYPCNLYLVEFNKNPEQFLKIGVTTNTVAQRFCKSKYAITVHCLYKLTISEALDQEKSIIEEFKNSKYQPLIKFKGQTECFEFNSLTNIKNVLLARNGQ